MLSTEHAVGHGRFYRTRRIMARAGLVVAIIVGALACGEYFPNMFLLRGDEVVLSASRFGFRPLVEPLVPKTVGTIVALPKANYTYIAAKDDGGKDLAAARAAGATSMAEFELYTKGRECFARGDHAGARAAWEQVLALPVAQRHWRSVWAAYMLGRTWHAQDAKRAARCYAQVRELAAAGFADSIGLATASIGWDARLAYEQRDLMRAIHLYLEQAAAKDPTAMVSLWRCGNKVSALHEGSLDQLAQDERVRRVVTAWLVSSNAFELAGVDEAVVRGPAFVARWLSAVERAGANEMAFADIIAWAAYQHGQFDMSKRWAMRAGDGAPRAVWIRAKLALRAGNVQESTTLLARAVRAMPPDMIDGESGWNWGAESVPNRELAAGEAGVLLLTSKQYEEAMDSFLISDDWGSAAYVAERLLTIDELRKYIERVWPAPAGVQSARANYSGREDGRALRDLYARRLVRLGEYQAARPYFPTALQTTLDRLSICLIEGRDATRTKDARARALMEAARITRHRGLELMGTELGPDSAWNDGGTAAPDLLVDRQRLPETRLLAVQPEEERRAKATALTPWKRFHYRSLGCDLAWEASLLMPDGSPTTAAVLCEAGSWIKVLEKDAADRFYKAMVTRCGNTPLGKAAAAKHWFPDLPISKRAFADAMPPSRGGNDPE